MRKSAKSLVIKLVPITAFFLMTAFFYFFRVQNVELRGTKSISGISSIDKELIFILNEEKLINTLLLQNPQVASIEIEKKYPNTIVLIAKESKIQASLLVDTGYYDLNKDSRIVGKHHESKKGSTIIKTGQLYPYSAYQVGDTISSQPLSTSLHLLSRLYEIGLYIDTIEVKGFDVLVFTKGKSQYLFLASASPEEQYARLFAVVRGLSLQGKKYQSIDVRFEKPIVKLLN